MKRFISIAAGALLISLVAGCGHRTSPGKPAQPIAKEQTLSNAAPPVVPVQIQSVALKAVGDKTVTTWLATYGTGPERAQFEFEFTQGKMQRPSKSKNPAMPDFETGEGAFIHVSGSHSAGLIQALAKVLEAKSVPSHIASRNRLLFTYVVLGENQERMPDGSFAGSPAGAWRSMKLFLGDDDGEFFFNMNPQTGQAEFSEKDSDYGNYDIKQLASVL